MSVFQINPCQHASVIGRDSVLERDLRRSVRVLVDDDIQESLRGWARGFCEQEYVEVVTHLDPGSVLIRSTESVQACVPCS